MKRKLLFLVGYFLVMLLALCPVIHAQVYSYLDVQPGYETLNLAVTNDASAPANRVYRLQRGGVYLLNGIVRNVNKQVLRIFAAEGTGKLPQIMTTADLTGVNYRAFELTGDGHFKNIYISGRSNLGIYTDDSKDMIRLQEIGIKMVVDGCFLEHEWKDFVRMNAKDQKIFIKNSILRNTGDLADASDNQFIDTRSLDQDTVFVQNSTLYTATGRGFRTGGTAGTYFRTFIMDHVTVYQVGNGDGARGRVDEDETPLFAVLKVQNLSVTNCLFMDVVFHGDEKNTYTLDDTLDYPIFGFVPLDIPGKADKDRTIVLRNNAYGVSADLAAYYASVDSLKGPVFLNKYSINKFFNAYPQTWTQKNNFVESVKFTDAPTATKMIAYTTYRRKNNFAEENVPEFWADRNGIGPDPSTWGPVDKEYDFSYPSTALAYTAGDGGFPLGDLNWFPALKTLWQSGGTVGVDGYGSSIISDHALEQNYPNPFNPITTISYSIPKPTNVSLEIFDVVGQRVATLVQNRFQNAGRYSVTWDGKDFNGKNVVSGIYVYQLKTEKLVISQKMLLTK